MRLRSCFLLLFLFTITAVAEIPIVDGLLIHSDAGLQTRIRAAAGLPLIGNLQPVDYLFANSNNPSFFTQTSPDRRPTLVFNGESAFLKFDGKDDYLNYSLPGKSIRELTIFLLH